MKELTYSLTFPQGFFNPVEVLVYRILQSMLLPIVFCFFIMEDPFKKVPFFLLAWFSLVLLYRCILGGIILTLQKHDVSRHMVVIIGTDMVEYGRKKIERTFCFPRKNATVYKGLFGVNVIRSAFSPDHGRRSIVIPTSVISFSELKTLIEIDDEPKK